MSFDTMLLFPLSVHTVCILPCKLPKLYFSIHGYGKLNVYIYICVALVFFAVSYFLILLRPLVLTDVLFVVSERQWVHLGSVILTSIIIHTLRRLEGTRDHEYPARAT